MSSQTRVRHERALPGGAPIFLVVALVVSGAGCSDTPSPSADASGPRDVETPDAASGVDDRDADDVGDAASTDDAGGTADTSSSPETGVDDARADGEGDVGGGPSCREVCDRVYDECELFLVDYTADKVAKSGCVDMCEWGYFVGERACVMEKSCGEEALNSCIAVDPAEPDLESVEPGSDWPESWRKYEQQAYALANLHRGRGVTCGDREFEPTPPLNHHPKVAEAARSHSLDMARNGFYDHRGSDGSTPSQRLAEAGYSPTASGEGINRTFGDPFSAVKSWLESPSHCARMTSPDHPYEDVGLGYVRAPEAEYGHYWTITYAAD